jgi:phospholipase/carboxylesterase
VNLQYQIINHPGSTPEKIVIGLHGWTGNEHSLKPLTIGLRDRRIEWHLLRGPYRSSTTEGYSWVKRLDDHRSGLEESTRAVQDHIGTITESGIKPADIYLLGFSQGAFMALNVVFKTSIEMGGCIAIAGFFPDAVEFIPVRSENDRMTNNFLLLHGKNDTIVQPDSSAGINRILSHRGFNSTLITYPAAHKIHIKAITDIRDFILRSSVIENVEDG